MREKIRTGLLILLITLILTFLLALAIGDFAREAIAVPIFYVMWLGSLVLRAIPQSIFWALFITAALFVAAKSMIKYTRSKPKLDEGEPIDLRRVHVLTRWVEYATQGRYFKRRLARHVGDLIVDTLAYRERLTRERVRRLLRAGELDLPLDVQEYIQIGLTSAPSRPVGLIARLTQLLRSNERSSELDQNLERTVQFLERQLEVEHGE